jgi:hypothetical protein
MEEEDPFSADFNNQPVPANAPPVPDSPPPVPDYVPPPLVNAGTDSSPLLDNAPSPPVPDQQETPAPPPPAPPPLPPSSNAPQEKDSPYVPKLSDILGPPPSNAELIYVDLQNFTISDFHKEAVLQKRARNRGVHGMVNNIMGFPWTLRRMVLNSDEQSLSYFNGEVLRDMIDVRGLYTREVSAVEADGRMNAFCLYDADNQEVLMLAAHNAVETSEWIKQLNLVARMS